MAALLYPDHSGPARMTWRPQGERALEIVWRGTFKPRDRGDDASLQARDLARQLDG